MLKAILFSVYLFLFPSFSPASGDGTRDERFRPINEASLRQEISQAPAGSESALLLTKRAANSKLVGVAYREYQKIWRTRPNDGNVNLSLGYAASLLWGEGPKPPIKSKEVFDTALMRLRKAVELMPKSSRAHTELGFFLWQYGNEMKEGLRILKQAYDLDSVNSITLSALGSVYINPSVPEFNQKTAEEYFSRAITSDNKFAYPRVRLAEIFLSQNRLSEAQLQLEAFRVLLPIDYTLSTYLRELFKKAKVIPESKAPKSR